MFKPTSSETAQVVVQRGKDQPMRDQREVAVEAPQNAGASIKHEEHTSQSGVHRAGQASATDHAWNYEDPIPGKVLIPTAGFFYLWNQTPERR